MAKKTKVQIIRPITCLKSLLEFNERVLNLTNVATFLTGMLPENVQPNMKAAIDHVLEFYQD